MNRFFLMAGLLMMTSHLCVSQNMWCDVDKQIESAKQNGTFDQFLRQVKEREQNPTFHTRSEKSYQVVVHVVSRDFYQPISKTQVIQQIDVLNSDFAGRGQNIKNLLDEFKPLVANTGIKFCLATTDPDGHPTEGITYTLTDIPDIALLFEQGHRVIQYDELGGKTGWDPTRYINIWLGEFGSFLGSASIPGMANYPEEIGVVIDIRAFGALGNSSANGFYDRGHTLSHEMGHFFGLLHIWGGNTNTCDDSDEVEDTPNAAQPYYYCPSGQQMSCGTSNMYQNFMDLTDDRCLAAFTLGQAARMQATIDVYYPDLDVASCQSVIQPFDPWWDELIWAYDYHSNQYVIYHPNGYADNIEIDVFSSDGRLMLHDAWGSNQSYRLDINVFPVGVYVVRVSDGEHEEVRKVVSY